MTTTQQAIKANIKPKNKNCPRESQSKRYLRSKILSSAFVCICLKHRAKRRQQWGRVLQETRWSQIQYPPAWIFHMQLACTAMLSWHSLALSSSCAFSPNKPWLSYSQATSLIFSPGANKNLTQRLFKTTLQCRKWIHGEKKNPHMILEYRKHI